MLKEETRSGLKLSLKQFPSQKLLGSFMSSQSPSTGTSSIKSMSCRGVRRRESQKIRRRSCKGIWRRNCRGKVKVYVGGEGPKGKKKGGMND